MKWFAPVPWRQTTSARPSPRDPLVSRPSLPPSPTPPAPSSGVGTRDTGRSTRDGSAPSPTPTCAAGGGAVPFDPRLPPHRDPRARADEGELLPVVAGVPAATGGMGVDRVVSGGMRGEPLLAVLHAGLGVVRSEAPGTRGKLVPGAVSSGQGRPYAGSHLTVSPNCRTSLSAVASPVKATATVPERVSAGLAFPVLE